MMEKSGLEVWVILGVKGAAERMCITSLPRLEAVLATRKDSFSRALMGTASRDAKECSLGRINSMGSSLSLIHI